MGQLACILHAEDSTLLPQAMTAPYADLTTAINTVLAAYTKARDEAFALLVQETTPLRSERIRTAGIIRGQRIDADGRPLEERIGDFYEVAYPWERLGYAMGWGSEDIQYLTIGDVQMNVDAIVAGNRADNIQAIWTRIYDNTAWSHTDLYGSLSIKPLANGDATPYAQPNGSAVTANNYLVSGYAEGSISATNNPLRQVRDKVWTFFPRTRVVALINPLQLPTLQNNLPNFVDASVVGVTAGSGESVATPLDGAPQIPGDFAGIDRDTGVYVYTYDTYVPDGYIDGIAIGAPAPLKRRWPEPPALRGFKLEAEQDHDPFHKQIYRERFGYGAANRLSMAVLQLKASGTYDIPTGFAR